MGKFLPPRWAGEIPKYYGSEGGVTYTMSEHLPTDTMTDPAQALLDKYGISPPLCGADLPDGWFSLVERLIVDLIDLGWDRDCHQIKVKFGGLRFYVGAASEECRDRIAAAEVEAESTCSICGAPGSFKNSNGRFVACGGHGRRES